MHFTITLTAGDSFAARAKVLRHAGRAGIAEVQHATCIDRKHARWEVQATLAEGASTDDAWFWLTSYGMSPSFTSKFDVEV